ncbi:MAG: hypothetical protein HC828_02295 [Blastochloris sp.]|nr:hypothetical protein [Blastochloris sp.]
MMLPIRRALGVLLLSLSLGLVPSVLQAQERPPTPTPPRPPASVDVRPQLVEYIYLSRTKPPTIIGMTLEVTSAVATTIDLTVTLEAPAIPGPARPIRPGARSPSLRGPPTRGWTVSR